MIPSAGFSSCDDDERHIFGLVDFYEERLEKTDSPTGLLYYKIARLLQIPTSIDCV